MQTECSADLFGFARVAGRSVVAAFDGGKITSDAGGLLLGAADQAVGLIDRFARCFRDSRSEELIEHTVATMVGHASLALRWAMKMSSITTSCGTTRSWRVSPASPSPRARTAPPWPPTPPPTH